MSFGIGMGCTDCGACIPACPRAAIHPTLFGPIPLTVNPLACNDCGACERVCPERAITSDPDWAACRGRGCPMTSRRYSTWACTESTRRCLDCGGPLWKDPEDGTWRCPTCDIAGRVTCPKMRRFVSLTQAGVMEPEGAVEAASRRCVGSGHGEPGERGGRSDRDDGDPGGVEEIAV